MLFTVLLYANASFAADPAPAPVAPPPPPAAPTVSVPSNARAAFQAGLNAFASSNYAEAVAAFDAAAAAAPAAKLDPAPASFNAGLAATAAGDLEAASTNFAAASSGSDLALQAKAYYNRGNALFQLSDTPLQMQPRSPAAGGAPSPAPNLDTSEAAIGQAVQMFENAIALDPKDVDAKANYELAVIKQQQIQQQQQQEQQKDQQKQDQKQQNQDQNQSQSGQDQDQPKPQPDQEKQQDQQNQQNQPQPQQGGQQEQAQQSQAQQQPESAEEMTPEEAEMLLDALKAQEQSQRDQLHPFLGRPVPVEKDW